MQMQQAMKAAELQYNLQVEQLRNQAKLALEQQKLDFEGRVKAAELQSQQAAAKYKTDIDAQTKLIIAGMGKTLPEPPLQQ